MHWKESESVLPIVWSSSSYLGISSLNFSPVFPPAIYCWCYIFHLRLWSGKNILRKELKTLNTKSRETAPKNARAHLVKYCPYFIDLLFHALSHLSIYCIDVSAILLPVHSSDINSRGL